MKIAFLIQQNFRVLSTFHTLPFNDALGKGVLQIRIFRNYLEQDKLYLREYAKALHLVAKRLDEAYASQIFLFLKGTIALEREIQETYLKELPSPSFFAKNQQTIQKMPVIDEYCQHLLETATEGSVQEAVVSLLPCFLVYKELGEGRFYQPLVLNILFEIGLALIQTKNSSTPL